MLGTRQTTVPRAALRRLRYSFNHPGGSTTVVTLVPQYSLFKYPIKSPLASNANSCFSTRIIDRESFSRSIRFYSTCLFSNSSSPRDVGSSSCSNSSVENNEADADEATDEAYEAMRNAAMDDAYHAIELALDSVVKIFSVASSPSYFLPWQNKIQRESMGSGFVISGRRILTNAHVVADHTFVLVRKHGSPIKYKAEVQAVGHECDLAILVVENEEFWEGMNFLELGDIPFIQEAVAVVGYPQGNAAVDISYGMWLKDEDFDRLERCLLCLLGGQNFCKQLHKFGDSLLDIGGDNISVTKGVVSRVELTQYVHSATQLLAIQIDAAINPGNSGGPAIMGDKVAGVAFQNLSNSENIGYIIPVPVIKRFIEGVEETGDYVGFCNIGLSCQPTENAQLREHFKMCPDLTGVLVSRIHPTSDAYRHLKKDDIILSFDGVPIANDGSVPFRNRERIIFDHLISMKKPNDTALVRVLRDGRELEFSITLRPLQPLVPVHQFDKLPSYYIFAGLVFIPLTHPYLHEYGEEWYNTSPRRLCERAFREVAQKAGQQLVILSQVLMDDINTGYERLTELQTLIFIVFFINFVGIDFLDKVQAAAVFYLGASLASVKGLAISCCKDGTDTVKKVNGTEVDNLKHLRQLVEENHIGNVRFDLDDGKVIVLDYDSAKVATSRILKRHRIPSAMSSDLNDEQIAPDVELACSN
ncbi:DegP protease 10 [Striga asiatica]|uniref:DegP protease 10 n=1 Tax=Striga asiatica TaxID=4170 RepID=A0A5A7R0W7_STRAF|nr:DegP protease 10 [Striga asiatica]